MDELAACKTPRYSHTQRAQLCLILYGSALACLAFAWMIEETSGIVIVSGVGLLMALLAPAFHHLSVYGQGDELAIRFGPLPLFHRTVRYADIEKIEVGRTLIFDGWGRHRAVAPDNATEIKAIEEDGGRFLAYVLLVGRRRGEAKLEEYCWPDTLRSSPQQYAKKPLLRSQEQ
jgi:hypothetical protein